MDYVVVLILILLPSIAFLCDFTIFAVTGKRRMHGDMAGFFEYIYVLVLPCLYLFVELDAKKDCCDQLSNAAISPAHKITFYVFVAWFIWSYFTLRNRKKPLAPLFYLILVSGVCAGIVISVALTFHSVTALFVNPGIIFLCLILLLQKQRAFVSDLESGTIVLKNGFLYRFFLKVYSLPFAVNFPLLLLLTLPVSAVLMAVLVVFGQKPDALIRAFTETYYHGFSQLDHECRNVQCGGHYLCSVAANGHTAVVKPQRYGYRNGAAIQCNRQLLVSNAFEQLLEEKMPRMHRLIRRNYNRVGNVVHRYYGVFSVRYVSDVVYVLMKPLEWLFLLVLYLFDAHPESRIARQYVDREKLARFEQQDQLMRQEN